MKYFTKKLYTYQGYSEFIFNRSLSAARYHVSVRNGEGKALVFSMEEKDNTWQIVNAAHMPEWITREEQVLADEIARRN